MTTESTICYLASVEKKCIGRFDYIENITSFENQRNPDHLRPRLARERATNDSDECTQSLLSYTRGVKNSVLRSRDSSEPINREARRYSYCDLSLNNEMTI